jgi:hypothetical protein
MPLLSLSLDTTICNWDLRSVCCLQVVTAFDPITNSLICSMLFSPKLQTLVMGSQRVFSWRTVDASDRNAMSHKVSLIGVVYSAVYDEVITVDTNCVANVWKAANSLCFSRYTLPHQAAPTCLVLDATGRRLITGASDWTFFVTRFHTGGVLGEVPPPVSPTSDIRYTGTNRLVRLCPDPVLPAGSQFESRLDQQPDIHGPTHTKQILTPFTRQLDEDELSGEVMALLNLGRIRGQKSETTLTGSTLAATGREEAGSALDSASHPPRADTAAAAADCAIALYHDTHLSRRT